MGLPGSSYPKEKTTRSPSTISRTWPEAVTPLGYRISTVPPGRPSIREPAPHQAAKRSLSLK